jgi:Tfp pilus assembly protein PilX
MRGLDRHGWRRRREERGTALLLGLIVIVLILGMTGAYLSVVLARSSTEVGRLNLDRAQKLADSALGVQISRLNAWSSNPGNGQTETFTRTVTQGTYTTTTTGTSDPNRFEVRVQATVEGTIARLFVVVQRDVEPLQGSLRGAVTARGTVKTVGSIQIDGRDHTENGWLNGSDGTFGISTKGSVTIGGASSVGGNGTAPTGAETATNREEAAVWGDGTDANGNGVIDPQERPYPDTPDEVLGLPDGTLKAMAIASGTYFTSEHSYEEWLDDYLDDHDDKMPSGVVIFLDFSSLSPTQMGAELNDQPSIIVQHSATGNAKMKNIHGKFKGLIISDLLEHLNGDAELVGGVFSLAADTLDTTFGNGSAHIKYSTSVLANLPDDPTSGQGFQVISYREEVQP